MAQERTQAIPCSSAETEDWLAMEFEEQHGRRSAAVAWCVAHPRPVLSAATIAVMGLVLGAMILG